MTTEHIVENIYYDVSQFIQEQHKFPTVLMSYALFRIIDSEYPIRENVIRIQAENGDEERKMFGCDVKVYKDDSISWMVGKLSCAEWERGGP